ncbi:Hsp20/alpha crystallin family protein [Thiococcus pfennigii]|uniref:Hsp20/alpha crystallin family protein n=1 Tax=Thiococcus pfennigii TaxID=1057 RepID=UPI001902FAA7|nr:Hsp20/alpha crystallin family protein [Thiococcus pfennigii]MBK1730982.1 heat-shock protein Hsp20 [Thiococcus pfennigii]
MKTKRTEMTTGDPHREMQSLGEMDRLFDTFFPRGWLRAWRRGWPEWMMTDEPLTMFGPRVDVIDREAEVLVRAELPGVERKDLAVELSGSMLTIRGERRREEKEERGEYFREEIEHGTFHRTLRLPQEVMADEVKAEFRDGILEVHLPKVAKTERKRIDIG